MKDIRIHSAGFHFQLFGGGNGPPLWGGLKGGGMGAEGGEMARDAFATS